MRGLARPRAAEHQGSSTPARYLVPPWSTGGARQRPGEVAVFADQAEAEEWLGPAWSELRDEGIDEVTLLAGEDEVYGPMSLHPPA